MSRRERVRWFELQGFTEVKPLMERVNLQLRRLGSLMTGSIVRTNSGTTDYERTRLNLMDSGSGAWTLTDDPTNDELVLTVASALRNWSTAAQTGFAADTMLTGSVVSLPATRGLKAGATYRVRFSVSKTAAGIAAPKFIVRVGTNGTTADTAVLTFTGGAQTAVVDTGWFEVQATWRSVGATGVLQGTLFGQHTKNAATGLIGNASPVFEVTGAAFDTTTASLKMGLSVNGGAAASWTVTQVTAELVNL